MKRKFDYRIVISLVIVIFAWSATATAQNIFSDDFESYGVQNPAPDPLGPWSYVGPGGDNSHRTWNPNGVGAGFNEIGWISLVDGSGITATFDFGALTGTEFEDGNGNLFDDNEYEVTFVHAAETSDDTRISIFGVDLTSSGTISFVSGGNGDSSQTFDGLTTQTGENTGGTVGLVPEREWTLRFSGTSLATSDSLTLSLSREGEVNNPFTWIDNVSVDVSDKKILLGDVNCDGSVNLLDVDPFVFLLTTGGFNPKADINQDGVVSLLDVDPFVELLVGP